VKKGELRTVLERTGSAIIAPPTALEAARKVYADSMWSSPDVSVCSCHCHGPSEANVEHHVEAIAAALTKERERGREEGRQQAADVNRNLSKEWDGLSHDAVVALTAAEKHIRALRRETAGEGKP
jgi:hypothetical protein